MVAEMTRTQLIFTRGVNDEVADSTRFAKFVTRSLAQFANGDWGVSDAEDKKANDADAVQLLTGEWGRILAAYEDNGERIWIIREPGVTTVLFPSEY